MYKILHSKEKIKNKHTSIYHLNSTHIKNNIACYSQQLPMGILAE